MPARASATPGSAKNSRMDSYAPSIFQSRGRIGRLRFFLYMSTMIFIPAALMLLAILVGVSSSSDGAGVALSLIVMLAWIPCMVMMVLHCTRRLNDFNATGWWLLLYFVPFVGLLIGLALLFAPGTPGPNRHGVPSTPNSDAEKALCVLVVIMSLVVLMASISIIDAGSLRY